MSLLNTSTSALLAFRRAMDTVSHNVANANTEGYSRQRTELATNAANAYGFGLVGSGVHVSAITRNVDSFQFARGLDSAGELARLNELATMSGRIDKTLSDSGSGLGAPWSGFFDASQALSSQPASGASRQSLLRAGESLAARFRTLDNGLAGMEREVSGKLTSVLQNANRLVANIANLNVEIERARGIGGGHDPNDLMDQRELLAGQLGGLLGVNTIMQDDGAMNLYMPGGQALLVGKAALTLATVADEFRPERLDIALQASGSQVRLGTAAVGGQLRGLMEFREDVLDPAAAQLGRVAATMVSQFNAAHREGVDFYGEMGGDFFAPIQPTIRSGAANAGTGTLTAALADPATFAGDDVVLAFDGANWSATAGASGIPLTMTGVGTVASPLRVGGIDVVVGGAPAAGDRFLLQPAAGAASRVRVAISDPSRIAAAGPLAASAALANNGSARVLGVDIDDVSAAGFLTSSSIAFTSPTTYTLNGSGPFAYSESAGIAGAGWTLRLSGPPATGDTFDIAPRGPGSSDNGNARLLATLDDLALLDSGTVSLNGAMASVTVQAGFSAQQYGYAHDAQTVVNNQQLAERESTSGVNLDEEAANLMKYQQTYQAAAQMIATASSMFDTVLAALRR